MILKSGTSDSVWRATCARKRASEPRVFFFGLPFHGRCIRVLHFEPIGGVAGTAQRKFTRADSLETCYPRRRCVTKEESMGRILASLALGGSLLVAVSSEASAWVCFATGLGSTGWGRSYDIIDAKLFALRRCERNSPLPVCTIIWCRPGG